MPEQGLVYGQAAGISLCSAQALGPGELSRRAVASKPFECSFVDSNTRDCRPSARSTSAAHALERNLLDELLFCECGVVCRVPA
jgi:hypothetical protein